MTTWHWVRHGPTHEKTFVGWRDVPADLSDTAQLARVTAHLPEIALIISSDLKRTRDTATAIKAAGHTPLPAAFNLREFNFGIWDGMGFEAVAARDPDLSRAFWETPGDVTAPDGESWNSAATRVNTVVDTMNDQHPDAHIIAVAHFGVILTQVQRALGVTPYKALAHKIDNLSVTTLSHQQGAWHAHVINHLP